MVSEGVELRMRLQMLGGTVFQILLKLIRRLLLLPEHGVDQGQVENRIVPDQCVDRYGKELHGSTAGPHG